MGTKNIHSKRLYWIGFTLTVFQTNTIKSVVISGILFYIHKGNYLYWHNRYKKNKPRKGLADC
jgi:hypothetical protein